MKMVVLVFVCFLSFFFFLGMVRKARLLESRVSLYGKKSFLVELKKKKKAEEMRIIFRGGELVALCSIKQI